MNELASLLIPLAAGKAGPGLLDVSTMSTSSNSRAIASLASRRIISAAAATRMLNRFSDSWIATRISSVRSAAHLGQRCSISP